MALNSTFHHPNSQYSFASPRNQNFSLPLDAILYLSNNCSSPEVFQKLQKTCKYFFNKNKVIIINFNAFYEGYDDIQRFYIKNKDGIKKNKDGEIDLVITDKNGNKIKYWLASHFTLLSFGYPKMQEPYLSMIYRCSVKVLEINYLTLNFKEICFLLNGKRIEDLMLDLCNIKYVDRFPVTIDAILSQCPRVIDVGYMNVPENFSSASMEKLNSIKFINKFERFSLGIFGFENGVYEEAREHLCQFIRKNINPNKEDKPCVHVYLYEGYYDNYDEFQDYFNQNLLGWKIRVDRYATGGSGRYPKNGYISDIDDDYN